MTPEQAKRLRYFTVSEIEATGAKIADVNHDLMQRLVEYRELIANPIKLIHNGLTTGVHEAGSWHYKPEGAVDWFHANPVHVNDVVEKLLRVGFGGIGAYHNGTLLSFHADPRKEIQLWHGLKAKPGDAWKYGPLVGMPIRW